MALLTTTIGAYPKPEYVSVPDWFREESTASSHPTEAYEAYLEDYPKADPEVYFRLAGPLDEAEIDAVSIEDAHRHNDLSLLERFKNTTVILGVIAIARSWVEPPEEIGTRLHDALNHIEAVRLMVSPDCGLGMLDRETARAKIRNMVQAARLVE